MFSTVQVALNFTETKLVALTLDGFALLDEATISGVVVRDGDLGFIKKGKMVGNRKETEGASVFPGNSNG